MKKLLFKVAIVVGMFLAVPYYLYGGSVKMPSFVQDFISWVSNIGDAPIETSSVKTDRDVTVYKWVDEQGRLHFSEKPPTGEVAEAIELKTDTNVMQAVKIPEPEEEESTGGQVFYLGSSDKTKTRKDTGENAETGEEMGEIENPYSPEGVEQLIQNAKNVGKMIENRQKIQQKALNGM